MLAGKSFTTHENRFMQSATATTSHTTQNTSDKEDKVVNIWDYYTKQTSSSTFRTYGWNPVSSGFIPANSILWQRADLILVKLWGHTEYVAPKVDDDWLNDIRSSWNDRIDELYDESDSGE